jgi:TIR domain
MSRFAGESEKADVFISYSKRDPTPTEHLARELETRGYSIWWDTRLLPGDEFDEVIRRKIREAKAVIVIWTTHSVRSRYVKAEAQLADQDNKLLPLRNSAISPNDIPLPYNALHTEQVDHIERVLEVLSARGVRPRKRHRGGRPAAVEPVTEPKLAELIWTRQLRDQYDTWDDVQYGEPMMVVRRPKVTQSENGDVTVERKGLVRRAKVKTQKAGGTTG